MSSGQLFSWGGSARPVTAGFDVSPAGRGVRPLLAAAASGPRPGRGRGVSRMLRGGVLRTLSPLSGSLGSRPSPLLSDTCVAAWGLLSGG